MHVVTIIASFVAALIGGLIGLMLLLPLGLILPEFLVFPLAHGVAGAIAALCAGWTATLMSRDGTPTRLAPVMVAVVCTSVLLAIVLVGAGSVRSLLGPLIIPAVISAILTAVVAAGVASHYRSRTATASAERRLTLAAVGVIIVLVPAVVFAASVLGLAGA